MNVRDSGIGTVVDPLTVAWTPGPTIESLSEVAELRRVLEAAGRALVRVPDNRLEAEWDWPGADPDTEAEVRYGFYRIFETLELARADALRAIAATGVRRPAGVRRGSAATVARWSLHGLLLPLADENLDREPGGGEWTIRQTLGHMFSAQRSYGRFTAWFLSQAPSPGARIPEALGDDLPEELEEAAGSLADVRRRLDDLLDLAMSRLGGLSDDDLEVPARWSGGLVTVGFRIGRWASHIREHTIQVEKTLAMLDRQPTEVERLVRLVFEAYGRLEEAVFGLAPDQVRPAPADGRSAADVLTGAAQTIAALPASILSAAGAPAAGDRPA
jgi:hypothetical protein